MLYLHVVSMYSLHHQANALVILPMSKFPPRHLQPATQAQTIPTQGSDKSGSSYPFQLIAVINCC